MGQFPNPEQTWKAGQSGNPNGAPKGKHISTWIQEMLNDEEFERLVPDKIEGYRLEKDAPIKAIIKTGILRAEAGDQRWADWIAKYGWGTKVTHASDPDNPINPPADKTLVDDFIEALKDATAKQAKSD